MTELLQIGLLLLGWIGRRRKITPHTEQGHVDARPAIRVGEAEARGDERAPVAALRGEALVAEHVGHQPRKDIRDLGDAETRLTRAEREPVPGKRRRYDRERVGR